MGLAGDSPQQGMEGTQGDMSEQALQKGRKTLSFLLSPSPAQCVLTHLPLCPHPTLQPRSKHVSSNFSSREGRMQLRASAEKCSIPFPNKKNVGCLAFFFGGGEEGLEEAVTAAISLPNMSQVTLHTLCTLLRCTSPLLKNNFKMQCADKTNTSLCAPIMRRDTVQV